MGDSGIIQNSSKNNIDVPYKDPVSMLKNFKWLNWKEFLSSSTNDCKGISNWHVIKVHPLYKYVQVANYIGDPFKKIEIFPKNFKDLIWPEIEDIEPE